MKILLTDTVGSKSHNIHACVIFKIFVVKIQIKFVKRVNTF